MIELLRRLNKVPDLFYYQLNGKSATENYIEQKERIYEDLANTEEDENDDPEFYFTLESRVK